MRVGSPFVGPVSKVGCCVVGALDDVACRLYTVVYTVLEGFEGRLFASYCIKQVLLLVC